MRKPLVAANWKMYKTPVETQAFLHTFLPLVKGHTHAEIVICPPSVDLATALHSAKGSNVGVGAQNMHFAEEGAFTGEVSAAMLIALGVSHVILGHSERRQYFAETDETVNKKLVTALKHHLVPIVCVGEHEAQRESGMTEEVLSRQVRGALHEIDAGKLRADGDCVRTYLGHWNGQDSDSHHRRRGSPDHPERGGTADGQAVADALRILYGGSVKPDNCKALMDQPEIDGALIGGASLDPKSLASIIGNG